MCVEFVLLKYFYICSNEFLYTLLLVMAMNIFAAMEGFVEITHCCLTRQHALFFASCRALASEALDALWPVGSACTPL